MQKQSISWSVKQLKRMFENGTISFEHPIQRKSGQWKILQKSELIHTLADDYPMPPIYAVKEGNIYFILDGKQRLSTLFDYINGEFAINDSVDSVIVEDISFDVSNHYFEDLPEEVQDQILSYMILVYKMDVTSDDEIEYLFLKLNQGTPLSKQQKAKAVLGVEWANTLNSIFEHDFMKEKAHFTEHQLRIAGDETTIIQTMMLLDTNHEFKNSSSTAVYNYTETFKNDKENKMALVDKLEKIMDYLNEAFKEKDKQLLKKVHLPMVLLTANHAIYKHDPPAIFAEWAIEFKLAIRQQGLFETKYSNFTGQGSTKQHMVLGRVNEMIDHYNVYTKAIIV